MADFCPQHEMVINHHQKIAQVDTKVDLILERQDKVFEHLGKLHNTAVHNEMNIGHLIGKVDTLNSYKDAVEKLVKSVDNGFANGKRAREEVPGLAGFLNRSWDKFCDRVGPLIITVFIALILWALTKTYVFQELPFWVTK